MRDAGLFWAVPVFVMAAASAHAADRVVPGTEARNAKAAFVYLSQATKDAALKPLDAALVEQRKRADQLSAKLTETRNQLALARKDASASKSRILELEQLADQAAAEAAEAQERFTQELAAKDEDYARELAILRSAADDILATPEGLRYLEANNAGDLAAADAIEEKLIAARQKMRDLQAAADRRAFAVVALDNRNKGLRKTEAVITRFEEVTRLDPGNHTDWITLARLHADVGSPDQAMKAAQRAQETAQNPAQRARALLQIAGFLSSHGENQNALTLLDQALKIGAQSDARTGKDSAVALAADIQSSRGDVLDRLHQPALAAYTEGVAGVRKAAELTPDDVSLRLGLAIALRQLGQSQLKGDDTEGGKASFAEALDIIDALIALDPADLRYRRFRASLLFQLAWRETDPAAAISLADRVIAELTPVADADGRHSTTLLLLLRAHTIKGSSLYEQDNLQDANAAYKAAYEIGEMLHAADPNNLMNYSWIRSNLATYAQSLHEAGLYEDSASICARLHEIVKAKADGSDLSINVLRNEYFLGYAGYRRALSLIKLERPEEARSALLSAQATVEMLLARELRFTHHVDLEASLLMELAELKEPAFTWARAIAFMEGAARTYPDPPDFSQNLAQARANAKRDGEILP